MRRVVVTGMGLVTPLGGNVATTWSRLINGESGAGSITRFDASDYTCRIACEVKTGDGTNGTFDRPDEVHGLEPLDFRIHYEDAQ